MTDSTVTKSKIFQEDVAFATGGTSAAETGTRLTSAGGTLTLTKIDASHLKYRSLPHTVEQAGDHYYDARGYGTTGTHIAISAAQDAIGSDKRVIYLAPGAWVLTDDLTMTAYVTLKLPPGAVITIPTAKTLTINGRLDAGAYQVFNCVGTGKVKFADGTVPWVLPEWWGAAGDGTTDCTAEIQLACDSLPTTGGVIWFGVGNYLITPDTITVSTAGTIFQGSGASNDGAGAEGGTTFKSAAGTGEMVYFLGTSTSVTLDSCQINDINLYGAAKTVIGLALKWVSNFRLRNVWVTDCRDDGVYMYQVWDSSFYDLEIESCGAQATGKVGLHIYNGADDNCNNLRFYSFHAETNYGDDVWIDSTGAGTGGNYNITFIGGKAEKNVAVGDYSTKAFHISGWNGATGKPNQNITIRDFSVINYYESGDIGIHWEGDGFMTVDNCFFTNNVDGATGITIAGPVVGPYTHRIVGNSFTNVAQEITIAATCPRNRVWTDGNTNTLYSETDSRIHINTPLVKDRRPVVLAQEGGTWDTVSTTATILNSVTLPADLLSTFGAVKIRASGYAEGSAGNKTITLSFGSSDLAVFPAGSLSNADWMIEAEIRNLTAGSQTVTWRFITLASPSTVNGDLAALTIDTTADVLIKVTGTCADGGDTIHMYDWYVVEE